MHVGRKGDRRSRLIVVFEEPRHPVLIGEIRAQMLAHRPGVLIAEPVV